MKVSLLFKIILIFISISACDSLVSYPDTPIVNYKGFNLYRTTDILGNEILLGKLDIEFTDGDGDIGINQPDSANVADSLKYNLFLSVHELKNGVLRKIEGDEGMLNFRVPFMERTGQNKTLKGTITVDIEYKTMEYEIIAYSFYLMDRAFHRSNTDTTQLIDFTLTDLSSD